MSVHRQQTRADFYVEPFEILIELVANSLDCSRQPRELTLEPVEADIYPVEPRIDCLEPCVRLCHGRSESSVDSAVERSELRVDAAFEPFKTRVHARVEGSNGHAKAADHSIVFLRRRCR